MDDFYAASLEKNNMDLQCFLLELLPVSNGGSELFLTYLRAQKELGTILAYLSVSAWVLFFLILDFYNFYF